MEAALRPSARVLLCATLLFAAVAPAALHAQQYPCPWPGPPQFMVNRASPPDSAVLTQAGGYAKVCYSQPSARGREVFGHLVRHGRVWRTGANEPTLLHLSAAAQVAGQRLEPGTYLLTTLPGPDSWSVVFSTSEGSTPQEMLSSMTEVGRGSAAVEPLSEHVETFRIRPFDDAGERGLLLEWARTRVRVPIRFDE
jgi:hypothetical protein